MTTHFIALPADQTDEVFDDLAGGDVVIHDLLMKLAGWGEIMTSQFGPGDEPFTAAIGQLPGGDIARAQESGNGNRVFELRPDLITMVAEGNWTSDGVLDFGEVNGKDTDATGFLRALQTVCTEAGNMGRGTVLAVSVA